jgi:hypothetical protein
MVTEYFLRFTTRRAIAEKKNAIERDLFIPGASATGIFGSR